MPPRTPEQRQRDAEFAARLRKSSEDFCKMSPVDQAIMMLEQRRSFSRRDGSSTDPESGGPEYVLLAAYRRLLRDRDADPTVSIAEFVKCYSSGVERPMLTTHERYVVIDAITRYVTKTPKGAAPLYDFDAMELPIEPSPAASKTQDHLEADDAPPSDIQASRVNTAGLEKIPGPLSDPTPAERAILLATANMTYQSRRNNMRFKVGNTWHEVGPESPLMVELTEEDRENIASMTPECTRYALFAGGRYASSEERLRWMNEDRVEKQAGVSRDDPPASDA